MQTASPLRVTDANEKFDARRQRLVVDLNRDLAGLLDLVAAYKQAHWNVVGPRFAGLHALFDQLAAETRVHADQVAERAVALGGIAQGTLQDAAQRSVLPQFPSTARREREVLDALISRAEKMADELRIAADHSADDLATQDIHIDALRTVEKQRWMLEAHILGDEVRPNES
jgi:starvation-inducible DNA-binding protein